MSDGQYVNKLSVAIISTPNKQLISRKGLFWLMVSVSGSLAPLLLGHAKAILHGGSCVAR
jgi:hypothetical protein